MKGKKLNQGFTLIELLVVIAIIGILSTVVLTNVGSARDKGADSAVKANLLNARAQSELFFINNSETYSGGVPASNVCSNDFAQDGTTKSIKSFVWAAGVATGLTPVNGDFLSAKVGNTSSVTCHANASAWAAEAPLKTRNLVGAASGIDMWCIDSTGVSSIYDNSTVTNGADFRCG